MTSARSETRCATIALFDRAQRRQGQVVVLWRTLQPTSREHEARLDDKTIAVPPGGATVVDIMLDAPGEYALVDHALPRIANRLIGKLIVQ